MSRISLDNGNRLVDVDDIDDAAVVNAIDHIEAWDGVVDEVREAVHGLPGTDSPREFLREFVREYESRTGEVFTLP